MNMAEEDKENNMNVTNYFTPQKPTTNQRKWSSKKFAPYSAPNSNCSGRFARILTRNSKFDNVRTDIHKGREVITNLTPPDSPQSLQLPLKKTPGISVLLRRELCEMSSDIRFAVGKTWRLHRCSPLHGFKTSCLENHKKLLAGHIMSAKTKGLAFEIDGEIISSRVLVDITVLRGFSFYDTDQKAVKVTVYQNNNNKFSPHLDAIFCNFGSDFEDCFELDGFAHLPLCMVKGPVSLSNCVLSWFQVQFDCTIIPLKLNPIELSWYASLWAGLKPDKKTGDFELCYDVPSNVKELKKVSFSIDANDVKLLWESCHSHGSDIFTGEESQVFMDALDSHFHRHFRIILVILLCQEYELQLCMLVVKDR